MAEFTEKSYGVVPVCLQSGGQFLVIEEKSRGGYWGFPKGHQEDFEHDVETALRELEEEVGFLPSELLEDAIFNETYTYDIGEKERKKKNTFYIGLCAERYEPKIQPEEIEAAKWLPYEQAKKQLTYQSTRNVLDEVYLSLHMNGLLR